MINIKTLRQKNFYYVLILILLFSALNLNFACAAQSSKAKKISALFTRVNPSLSAKTADSYASLVIKAGEKYKQDPYVIAGIIVHESTVNNKAVSKGGDYGLMQIRWNVHEKAIKKDFPKVKKAKDLFDAKTNIFYGTRIFAECMSKSSSTRAGLLRYSAGSEKLANKVLATVNE